MPQYVHVMQYAAQVALGYQNPQNGIPLCGGLRSDRDISSAGRTRAQVLDLVSRSGFSCDECRAIWIGLQAQPTWLQARHANRTKREYARTQDSGTARPPDAGEDRGTDDFDDPIRDGDDDP